MSIVNALRIHPDDSVAVALRDLAAGTPLVLSPDGATPEVTTREAIPYGHKIALQDIPCGQQVVKYGAPIGRTSVDIVAGAHVHVHNLRSVRGAVKP